MVHFVLHWDVCLCVCVCVLLSHSLGCSLTCSLCLSVCLPVTSYLIICLLILYQIKLGRRYIRDSSLVPAYPLLLFGGDIVVDHKDQIITVDNWIRLKVILTVVVVAELVLVTLAEANRCLQHVR